MVKISAHCLIQGDSFSPSVAEKLSNIVFVEKNEPGSIGNNGRYKGIPVPYGSATLEVETLQNDSNGIDALINTLKECIVKLRQAGADDIILHCDVFYEDQCNFELAVHQIVAMAQMKIPMTISCYNDRVWHPVKSRSKR